MTISGLCPSIARCSSSTDRRLAATALVLAIVALTGAGCRDDSAPGTSGSESAQPSRTAWTQVLRPAPADRLLVIVIENGEACRRAEPTLWTSLDVLASRSRRLSHSPAARGDFMGGALATLARALHLVRPRVAVFGFPELSDLPSRLAPARDLNLQTSIPGHWWQDLSPADRENLAGALVSIEDARWELVLLRLRGIAADKTWRRPGSKLLSAAGERAQALSLAISTLIARAGSNATVLLAWEDAQGPSRLLLAGTSVTLLPASASTTDEDVRKLSPSDLSDLAGALLGWRPDQPGPPPPEVDWSPKECERWLRGD